MVVVFLGIGGVLDILDECEFGVTSDRKFFRAML